MKPLNKVKNYKEGDIFKTEYPNVYKSIMNNSDKDDKIRRLLNWLDVVIEDYTEVKSNYINDGI